MKKTAFISQWRQDAGTQEVVFEFDLLPVAQLFNGTRDTFSTLLKLMDKTGSPASSVFYDDLKKQFIRYFLWYQGFSQILGGLDRLLINSQELRATLLEIMVLWGRCVQRIPAIGQDYAWEPVKGHLRDYALLIDRTGEIAEASMPHPPDSFSHDLELLDFSDDESSLSSEPDSNTSDDSHNRLINDCATWMDALIGLSPSLACPAPDGDLFKETEAVLSEDLASIPDSYRSFVIAIKDAFPSVSTKLAKKLGEGNLKRIDRLRSIRETQVALALVASPLKIRGFQDHSGTYGGASESTSVGFSMSDPSDPSNRSISTGNSGSGPSLFDRRLVEIPAISSTNSVVSLSTSTGDGRITGQRRMPPPPHGHQLGSPLPCEICNCTLNNIRNLNDWHKHIKYDLEPYMCLSLDCSLGFSTFRTTKEWMDHEFQEHHKTYQWLCNICTETRYFNRARSFEDHLKTQHLKDVPNHQSSALILAARRVISTNLEIEHGLVCDSQSSDDSSDNSDVYGENDSPLASELLGCSIQWPPGESTYFIPYGSIEKLLTFESIRSELVRIHGSEMHFPDDYAHRILSLAPKIFTVLIMGNLERRRGAYSVCDLLDHGITDYDLPFHRHSSQVFFLCCNSQQHPAKAMDEWSPKSRMTFYEDQWIVLAPAFESVDGTPPSFDLDQNTRLPYRMDCEHDPDHIVNGWSSRVWPIRIVAEHQTLYHPTGRNGPESEPLLAVKQLNNVSQLEFYHEVDMLRLITTMRHRHLIQLLATYRFQGRHHFLFPFPDKNLRTYWEAISMPYHNRLTHRWVLDQMTGLASALTAVHAYRKNLAGEEVYIENDGSAFSRLRTLESKSVDFVPKPRQEGFLCHGDLNAENILWKIDEQDINGPGILIIAGLGLTEFHNKDSRPNEIPNELGRYMTYNPPESALEGPISSAFDVWGLGCVYLEFLTWLFTGEAGLQKFHGLRLAPTLIPEIEDDQYYDLVKSPSETKAIIRPAVTTCLRNLRNHPRSSDVMGEVLNLIEHQMLVVKPEDRISATKLHANLRQIYRHSREDENLLLGADEGLGVLIPERFSL